MDRRSWFCNCCDGDGFAEADGDGGGACADDDDAAAGVKCILPLEILTRKHNISYISISHDRTVITAIQGTFAPCQVHSARKRRTNPTPNQVSLRIKHPRQSTRHCYSKGSTAVRGVRRAGHDFNQCLAACEPRLG